MKKAVSVILGIGIFSGLMYLSWKLSDLLSATMVKSSHLIRDIILIIFWILLIIASIVIAALLAQLAYRLWGIIADRRKKS
jgi:hypothetical protein